MLGNIKDLYQLQSQAREMQKKLEGQTVEAESNGIKVVMTGKQEVVSVSLNPELSQAEQEKYLVEVLNEAVKKVQQLMAGMMMG